METQEYGFNDGRIHFVGIGGIGMSGIASILLSQGYAVSGSDLKDSPAVQRLRKSGARVFLGHNASNIEGAVTIVYSSAIKPDNPELFAAAKNGVPVIKRAEALAKLMNNKTCIAVSGAHGKTTTTSLISHLLLGAGFSPTVAIGGILRNLGNNACAGKSEYFVAEADESDGTFLCYKPDYSVITNIDMEHLDFYKDWDSILSAYAKFMSGTKDKGVILACGDDAAIRLLTKGMPKKRIYYGLLDSNDFYPGDIKLNEFSSSYNCYFKDKLLGRIYLPLAGRHNISNSLSAVALGINLGIDFKKINSILAAFLGAERRFQVKADINGIKIIDDYGHHPSEIRATLLAAKNVRHKRLIVLFQPHRFSRTKFLMNDFALSFTGADHLVISDIYAASEQAIDGVNSQVLCEKIVQLTGQKAVYLNKEKIFKYITNMLMPGDVVLTLGAGDIVKASDELAQWLKGQNSL